MGCNPPAGEAAERCATAGLVMMADGSTDSFTKPESKRKQATVIPRIAEESSPYLCTALSSPSGCLPCCVVKQWLRQAPSAALSTLLPSAKQDSVSSWFGGTQRKGGVRDKGGWIRKLQAAWRKKASKSFGSTYSAMMDTSSCRSRPIMT